MGYDHDDEQARGEFGKCGVAVSSLRDMQRLFEGIALDSVSTSMTINSPAAVLFAMYVAMADHSGVPRAVLRGTLQNDILKEYIAQNEYIFPPAPSMRLVTDTIEFATRETPLFNPISVSGYHIREAGATAAQELAFTLADGFEYVRWALDRGLAIDEFAPRISFFFNAHNDLFEEVAKYRAARRIWARELRHRFGARNPRSWWLRFHAQTAGVALTAEQPEVNMARVALQALAATLGGAQSLHTNALDEALALPTEHAARLAVRTQQVLRHETGVVNTVDPLGGAYFVEALTSDIEAEAYEYLRRIDEFGGVIPALEAGFQQAEIAEASYRFQRELGAGRRVVVGVNAYQDDGSPGIPLLRVDEAGEGRHLQRLRTLRVHRDDRKVNAALDAVAAACRDERANTMPALIDAVKVYCTLGEICGVMRNVFGEYVAAPAA
jgi:methylmalonyl-CoA mutase N-terminal domain/subunit